MRDLIQRLTPRYALGAPVFQRPDLAFVDLVDTAALRALLLELRDREGFTHLVLLTAVDWLEEGRFQLTYMLNNRAANRTLGLRVYLDRAVAVGETIHDIWPTAETYQRELREMFGIDFPGSPRVNDEFILEGWTDLPPYRRDFDTLAYSQQTYRDRPGRATTDPRAHMKQKLYPEGVRMFSFNPDRSQYPDVGPDGKLEVDIETGKFLKLWHGPNHPGITGNMALEVTVNGDEVVEARTRVGYLHRGFEKLMERRTFIQVFPIVCRVCVPEPDFNEYCYAAAVEELAGIAVPEAADWIRTLILEMGRFNSYMMAMGGIGGALGMGLPGQWMTYVRDLMLDRFEELTGARIYHMFILPGGVRGHLPEGFAGRMEETLRTAERYIADLDRVMFTNAVFQKRTRGVGVIDPALFEPYGVTGPNARAGGVAKDVRKDAPYLVYDRLDFDVVTETGSDIWARARVRFRDLKVTIDLIRQILARMPKDGPVMTPLPNVLHWKIPRGETYIKGEASRGEYGYYLVTDGSGYPRRINVRGPSYTHAMALLEHLIPGTNIADIAALMVSLHTYPPEIER